MAGNWHFYLAENHANVIVHSDFAYILLLDLYDYLKVYTGTSLFVISATLDQMIFFFQVLDIFSIRKVGIFILRINTIDIFYYVVTQLVYSVPIIQLTLSR